MKRKFTQPQKVTFLPATLRRKYGIKNGIKIIVNGIGNAIVLKPVAEQYLRNLQGSLKGKGGLKTPIEENAARKGKSKQGDRSP
ncbi:MAG TPA: hypothetical protein VNK49_05605 [Anaerolineales bacterium]|nr:hypothetical protein [Anaerolineales bacterium]